MITLIGAREFLRGKNEIKKEVKKLLNDIKNWKTIKELLFEYKISYSTLNRWIKKIIGKFGVYRYTVARKFLQDKDIDEVTEEIDK